jgi:tetratricopeptide (TPR) repeat protein
MRATMRAAMNVDYDPAPRLPVSPGERVFVVALAFGLGALLVADLAQGFSTNKLSVLFVLLFWGPLLVLHELGHAFAARLVGWRVTEIVIGFGRELRRFRVGSTRVRVRAVPVEGYVLAAPTSTGWARAKQAWIYFAGPLTELLVLAALAPVLELELPKPGDSVGRVALQSLGVTAALGALCTLFPYRSLGNPSDGLGMLTSWLASEQSFRERLAWPFIEEARRLLLREQLALAEQALAAGLGQHPGEPRLAGMLAVCQATAGNGEAAYHTLEALGPPDERPAAIRAELLADAAWSVLSARDTPLLPEAERALERALELSPGDPHLEILLGRVHLERGRPHDAYRRLMSAYKRTRDVDQEAQCVAYLALACQALNGLSDALREAAYAPRFEAAVRTHDVPPALRQRALQHTSPTRG